MYIDTFTAPITKEPRTKALRLLQAAGVIVMVLSGADKFFNILADWHVYLSPLATMLIPFPTNTLLYALGVIEVVLGITIAINPKIGGVLGALLHLGIISNLLLLGNYYNIAVVDFGLLLAYLALWQLAMAQEKDN